jgi:hypothetical protein
MRKEAMIQMPLIVRFPHGKAQVPTPPTENLYLLPNCKRRPDLDDYLSRTCERAVERGKESLVPDPPSLPPRQAPSENPVWAHTQLNQTHTYRRICTDAYAPTHCTRRMSSSRRERRKRRRNRESLPTTFYLQGPQHDESGPWPAPSPCQ